jgi:hypothetical protein
LSAEAELPAAGGIGVAVVGLASPSGDGGTGGLLSSAILIVLSINYEVVVYLKSLSVLKQCERPSLLTAC